MAQAPPPPPNDPWRPSPDYDAQANADFSLKVSSPGNVRLAGTEAGADWPNFNGPRRENKSPEIGLLKKWPPRGPKLAWMCRGLGAGFASVSVARGILYTMGNKGKCEAVIALDAGTGEKIWSTPFAWAAHLRAGEGPVSTPTVNEGAVYALGGYGDLVCLDAHSGEIRWQKNILREFSAEVLDCGMRESVLIDGNRLICTPGGEQATLAALDTRTGDVIWKCARPGTTTGPATPRPSSPKSTACGNTSIHGPRTIGVRADTGELLWRDDSASNTTANCSSPLVEGNFVFTSSDYGSGGSLVKLSSDAAGGESDLVYHTRDMNSHHGEMVIVDGLLYGSSEPGILDVSRAGDREGEMAKPRRAKGRSPMPTGGSTSRRSRDRGARRGTGAGYHELGRFEQPERSKSSAWSHPVVADGRLFLSDQDLLFCYDLKDAT